MINQVRYISTLDSVPSTRLSIGLPASDRWWLPSKMGSLVARSYAKSELMVRLLLGDRIGLPRNQSFDSVSVLDALHPLSQSDSRRIMVGLILKKNDKATANQFARDVSDSFANPNFVLSAWPGLDPNQRSRISKNIVRGEGFDGMLEGVGLDPSQKESFSKQAVALISFHQYLKANPEACYEVQPSSPSLWDRLCHGSIRKMLHDEAASFYDIPKKMKEGESLNNRGILYKYIEDFSKGTRADLRNLIDTQYHYMLADSITKGASSIAVGTYDPDSDLSSSLLQSGISDSQYEPSAAVNLYALGAYTEGIGEFLPLDWDTVLDLLDDPCYKASLMRMQAAASEHKQSNDELFQHLEFLSEALASRMKLTTLSKGDIDAFSLLIPLGVSLSVGLAFKVLNAPLLGQIIAMSVASEASRFLSRLLAIEFKGRSKRKAQYKLAGRIRDSLGGNMQSQE